MAVVFLGERVSRWGTWQGPAGGQSTRFYDESVPPPDSRWTTSIRSKRFQGDFSQWIPSDNGVLSRAQAQGPGVHPMETWRYTEFWARFNSVAYRASDDFHMCWEIHTPSADPGGITTINLRNAPDQVMLRRWVGPGAFTHGYHGRVSLELGVWNHYMIGFRPSVGSSGGIIYRRNGTLLYEAYNYQSTTQSGTHYPEIGWYTYWSTSGTDDYNIAGYQVHDVEPPYPGGGGGTFAIAPYPTTSVDIGTTRQFTANQPAVWSLNPPTGRGTITGAGLYTAPAPAPSPNTVQVTGTAGVLSSTTTVTITTPTQDARLAGILLGGKSPTDGAAGSLMDKFQGVGVVFVADRHAPDDSGYRDWLVDARAAGTETLYYVCPGVAHAFVSSGGSEDARIYGGTNQSSVFNLHPDWFWSWQTGRPPQDFTEDGLGWLMNMRPGSAWITHFVDWASDFYANRSLHTGATIFNGLLLDMCANDMLSEPSNWSSGYADLWTEGCHELVRKLRTALGPDVLLVANGNWHQRREIVYPKDISTISPVDSNNRPSMLKGGHPDLNGRMFEEIQRWSGGVDTVRRQIDKLAISSPVALAPGGYAWAESQSGRVAVRPRFLGFDFLNATTTSIAPYVDVGAISAPHSIGFLNGTGPSYQSYSQDTVPGVVTNAELLNHVPNSWVYAGTDVTPPLPGDVVSVSFFNGQTTVNYSLPVDADRASAAVARKSAAWLGTDTPTAGVTMTTLSPGAAGAGSYQSVVPAGTWYFKVFTSDAAGNINRDGAAVPYNVPNTPADTTPPLTPTDVDVTVTGQALAVDVTLPEDSDRVKTVVARRTAAWGGGASYTTGVVMAIIEPGGLGVNSFTETGLGAATYYIKAFTEDAVGNVNTDGPSVQATVAAPVPQVSGRIGGWPRRWPVVGHVAGRATFSGTGEIAQFTIPHGLGTTPRVVSVTAGSADADGDFYATASATNITVTFVASPPAGDGNVVLNWTVEA